MLPTSQTTLFCTIVVLFHTLSTMPMGAASPPPSNTRPPAHDADLRYWLENMILHHHFTLDEASLATGISPDHLAQAMKRWDIDLASTPIPAPSSDRPLLVLPYPGGRHPRIGFLEGAIRPQRETKISVFAPWDPSSYAVLDIPEALWSNLGLTYLAHTHIPTIWEHRNINLEPLEWTRHADGSLSMTRTLPNGIRFGTVVHPMKDHVRMTLSLHNGSPHPLSDLRVQNCVMLRGMKGFDQQDNSNKIPKPPYATCRSEDGTRWLITAWTPLHRTWANPDCPCMHSDPQFPDCAPGQTQVLQGWFSFYEGTDIDAEITRIHATGWHER